MAEAVLHLSPGLCLRFAQMRAWITHFAALPTMAVGFNQAIMFAFVLVISTAVIGAQDLSPEFPRTRAGTNLGKNFGLWFSRSQMVLAFDKTP